MAENKITYIQTSEHAIVGESGGQAQRLEPGERVLFNEEADSHKYLRKLIEAGDESVAHLSIVEVSPKEEAKAKEELQEQLAKAEKIAAKARAEELEGLQAQQDRQQEATGDVQPHSDPTDFPPVDEEAIRLAKESGAGQRASTQEDVADEDKEERSPKSGRRSSRSGGKG